MHGMFRIGAILAPARIGAAPVSGPVVWLTGMSGAGKTTIAQALRDTLMTNGVRSVYIIDGDVLRAGLCSDLGFSENDKREQARRAAELARVVSSLGVMTIVALISPYEESRKKARQICASRFWFEVYVRCSEDERRKRDPKGLYARLDAGEIAGMSGVDAPYEEPSQPSVSVDTGKYSVEECIEQIVDRMLSEGLLG
jgi:adenylyl-sulfate kinase